MQPVLGQFTVRFQTALSFAGAGSISFPTMDSVFTWAPAVVARNNTVNSTKSPAGIAPTVHVSTPVAGVHETLCALLT